MDACVPRPLRGFLRAHEVSTAQEMGWGTLKNGELLKAVEREFDAFLTSDRNLRYQQNLADRKIAILILPTNAWPILKRMGERIGKSVDRLTPGDFVELPLE